MNESIKILLLGTCHFGKSGKHLMNLDSGDINSIKKQEEINDILKRIIKFKPNKIAVEVKREKDIELNEMYSEFCDNNFVKENNLLDSKSEVIHIGFNLARQLKHNKLYPLDVGVSLPEDVFNYINKYSNVYSDYIDRVNEYELRENEFMKNHTLLEVFKHLNSPDRYDTEHSDLYLYLNKVCNGNKYYGVNTLVEWYRRNLYIFSNIQNIANCGDRILVLYGVGHFKILKTLINDYNEFEFVDPLDYL